MKVNARAKLNLHLRVLAREESGYHQLETVFCRLDLADELEVDRAKSGIRLEVEGPDLGPVEENLVMRAARAFFQRTEIKGGARVHLVKRIPAGGGLGGGSSDAASTLLALNRLHDHPLHNGELLELAVELGADVPFFAADTPVALAWGRGERLLALDALPRTHVLLAVPPFAVSTAEAYAALDSLSDWSPAAPPPAPLLHHVAAYRTWTTLAPGATNDFEPVIFARHPQLPALKQALHAHGAFLSLMSGSGSTVFGLFRTPAALHAAHEDLRVAFDDIAFLETATDGGEREDLLG